MLARVFIRISRRFGSLQALDPGLHDSDILAVLWRAGWSFLRGSWLRLFVGQSSGPVLVGKSADITHARHLSVGRMVKIEANAELHCLSTDGVHLGERVTVGRGASIRPSSYYGGLLGAGLTVGAGSSIGAYSWIGASGPVQIGSDVLLGPRVVVIPENHVYESTSVSIKSQGVTRAGVTIEDDCWLGANAVVLAGVRIGRGSIVASGAVVTRDVPPFSIVAGVPARRLRDRRGEAA